MSENGASIAQKRSTSRVRFVIDGHQDIAWNWLEAGRDPCESALVTREREVGTAVESSAGLRTSGLPEWIQGRLAIILASLFVPPERHARRLGARLAYGTVQQAHDYAFQQLDAYWELAERDTRVELITKRSDLDHVVSTWTSNNTNPVVGLVLSMEGADPIRQPAEIEEWYARGLRAVGLSWVATRYAGGTGEPGPVTGPGVRLLSAMASLNMILDLSHMAERACLQTLDVYSGPVIASHSNPRRFYPSDRSLTDEMIRRLAERGGVIGIVPYNTFLRPEWRRKEDVTVDLVAEAIDYVAQLVGSSTAVALGSDFDGGLGAGSIPAGMDTVADLYLVADALTGRGYSEGDVELVMNGNWLRILQGCLP